MKLLLIILVILVVYIFIRRASASHSISADHYQPPQPPTIDADARFVDSDHASVTADAKPQYEITRYYFAHTDAEQGPTDPDVFYDELFIDLTNTDTGEKFENHMFVCTPRGLTEEMIKEQWDSVVGTELLIARRYNLDAILAGAKHHLEEIYESTLKIAPRRPGKRDYVG